MRVDEAPGDEDSGVRHTYNFAPGNHGLVYRADAPGHGGEEDSQGEGEQHNHPNEKVDEKYKLQAMKWGTCIGRLSLWLVGLLMCACADADYTRPHPFLDKAESGLRVHAQDNQLP